MRKVLLSSVAACGLALAAAPAFAEDGGVKLDLGGWYKGYGVFIDQDIATGYTASEERSFDILHNMEIHFSGETTLDNGLTVGAHFEMEADAVNDPTMEESYAYFSGGWGRVNLGAEDGVAYLLQVAAPSADANVDGIRTYVQPVDYTLALASGAGLFAGTAAGPAFSDQETLFFDFGYDQNPTGALPGITYLTPVLNGFQAGLTYKPDVDEAPRDMVGSAGVAQDDLNEAYGEAYEGAIRYEGMFNEVGITLGAGYTHIELEKDTDGPTADSVIFGTAIDLDDRQVWNVGADFDIGPFGLGVVYTEDDLGVDDDGDQDTLVVGVDYTTGPFKLGASWYNRDNEVGPSAGSIETDRYTGGVVYTYGPGMTFRGSISYIEHDIPVAIADDVEATSVLLGTQINF